MLCSKCKAYVKGCTISQGKNGASCRLSIEQIELRLLLQKKTEELDKIAIRYYNTKDKDIKKEWKERVEYEYKSDDSRQI